MTPKYSDGHAISHLHSAKCSSRNSRPWVLWLATCLYRFTALRSPQQTLCESPTTHPHIGPPNPTPMTSIWFVDMFKVPEYQQSPTCSFSPNLTSHQIILTHMLVNWSFVDTDHFGPTFPRLSILTNFLASMKQLTITRTHPTLFSANDTLLPRLGSEPLAT